MTVKEQKLLTDMAKLGFPMLEPAEELDVNETLAEVVRSQKLRFWESFPVLLANAADNYQFIPKEVERKLETAAEKKHFRRLVILSGLLFIQYNLSFAWWRGFKKELSNEEKELLKTWRDFLVHNRNIKWDDTELDPERLKNLFELYFENRAEKSKRLELKFEEFSLEFSLSKIFSPKQSELFKRKLEGLPMDKTEQEYFSRVVKKKVIALANPQLHKMARKLLEQ
jgi:hypothetical protein